MMLVYGDHRENVDPAERLQTIGRQLAAIGAMASGIRRHGKLAGILVQAGQLQQGVADEGYPDAWLGELVHGLAAALVSSWDSRFADIGDLPTVLQMQLPRSVELRLPEGFAFYCLYPEAYAEAARRLILRGPPRVIGIRSIGTTLGAVAAAALDAPPPLTLRPYGDPFARNVELPSSFVDHGGHYIIVDEGPGLSGSSFGCLADALERRGVPLDRVAFLPSHGGDLGPEASKAHRERWAKCQRVAAEFDDRWLSELFGPLEEIAGGDAWSRRKYLAWRTGERVLLRFGGLGAIGERKMQMARALHAGGFIPEPLDLVHGFLVERWCENARPLSPDEKPIEAIGRYVGARARLFPADEESGATIAELLTMCRRNISLALGGPEASRLDRFDALRLQARVHRVRTDNKLDRGEWLRLADGRLLKADAVDHHQGHDLIGCQDVAWDVAGATIEFDLMPDDTARLIALTGRDVDPALLELFRIAYSAFRVGRASIVGNDSEVRRYRGSLDLLLDQHVGRETRQKTLVD
jgi:hypothetical protein